MQNTQTTNNTSVEEFKDLMEEVAELGEQEAKIVCYFAQGVIATAKVGKTREAAENEAK